MRNVILSGDDSPVLEPCGDVVRKVGVERRQDTYPLGHGADGAQEINGSLEATCEEASTCEEDVADAGTGEVEAAGGPHALDDLEVEAVEIGPDEFTLGGRDVAPQRVRGLENLEPLGTRFRMDLGQAVVEEVLDGDRLGVIVGWDEPHQA